MANADTPRGFRPVQYASGKAYTGAANRYYKSATAGIIGVGDPVIRVTNSSDPDGYPEIVRASTGAAITGVVVSIEPSRDALHQRHLASADTGYVQVADDPDLWFEVQEDSNASNLAIANIGEHIDSVAAIDADTVTGISKYELDSSELAADNTWRLEKRVQRADNELGANCNWLVSPNLHTEANASASRKTAV